MIDIVFNKKKKGSKRVKTYELCDLTVYSYTFSSFARL